MTLRQLADQYIPVPENKKVLKKAGGITRDIIKEVLDCFAENKEQLKKFAPFLKGNSVLETCNNIWKFWKNNITYKIDDEGVQWIKTPAAVWASKFCDCKSFSVAIASTLHCLGIDGKFRFTSYGSNTVQPTHVYVVAMDGEKEIIIDCVWNAFNSEKPFAKKWEYNMTTIYRISGVDPEYKIGQLNADLNDPGLTEAEFGLALTVQGLEIEQNILRRNGVFGIGSTGDDSYQVLIEGHRVVLNALRRQRKGIVLTAAQREEMFNKWQQRHAAVGDVGFLKKLVKNIGKGIKKVAKGVAKGVKNLGKAITKVVKTPARLAAQGALKDSGGFFLYLFIDTNKIPIAKLPQAVQVKRQKALEYRERVVKKLQMPGKNFDQIVRNSIMTAFGNTPENVLAEWMRNANFKIGFLSMATDLISQAGGMLKGLFGKLGEDLGKDIDQFSPAPEDWGVVAANPDLANNMATAATSFNMSSGSGGGYMYPGMYYGNTGGDQADNRGNENTGTPKEGYDSQGREIWQMNVDEAGNEESYTSMATGTTVTQRPYTGDNKNVITEPDARVYSKKRVASGSDEKSDNTGLLIFGGLALAVLASKK